MGKHFFRFILAGFIMLLSHNVQSQTFEKDTLVAVLRQEAQFYLDQLKKKEIPAYFISFRVTDLKRIALSSDFGLYSADETHTRTLTPQVRVGSPEYDNFTYKSQNFQLISSTEPEERPSRSLPIDQDNISTIKDVIWNCIQERYKTAVKVYLEAISNQKNQTSELDSIPSFAPATAASYYEQPYKETDTRINKEKYQKYLGDASRLFKNYKKLTTGRITLEYSLQRTTFVNTEGTVVAQNRKTYLLCLEAVSQASDGTDCSLFENIFTYSEDSLPSPKELAEKVQDLAERTVALSEAPLAEAYTGPALLSGSASAVFFHEVLAHRLEASRTKSVNNAIAPLMGKRILPASLQLYLDPTLKTYQGRELNGHYLYDEEGVKGERVDCIKDGVLQQYLMSRAPAKGFTGSNGHGRADVNFDPEPRQSNLIIETTAPYTTEELRNKFIEELKRQEKEYGYYFRTVNGGFTTLGGSNPKSVNVFKVTPIEVYRVFTDGRKDQLVRGVSLIGTPLSMFSHIKAAGGETELFTGFCGAGSGFIPVSGTSPMVYVSQIETQGHKPFTHDKELLIGTPETEETVQTGNMEDSTLIFKAMEDEMNHLYQELSDKHKPCPLFVDYILQRTYVSETESSGGTCVNQKENGVKNQVVSHIFLGDTLLKNDLGRTVAQTIPDELDYLALRASLREYSEKAYRNATSHLDAKRNSLKRNPKPEAEANVPEFSIMPPAVWIGPSALTGHCSIKDLKTLSNRLSEVFLQYPELFNHRVVIQQKRTDYYRLTSEGQKILQPDSLLTISAEASSRNEDGQINKEYYSLNAGSLGDLPSEETLIQELHRFARYVLKMDHAASAEDLYIGPVLYEDKAVQDLLEKQISNYAHFNWNGGNNRSDRKYRYVGKQIFPSLLSVYQLGRDSVYNGVKLLGYRQVDADGKQPMTLPIIEKGVLKNLLTGRTPTLGCPASTGNEHFHTSHRDIRTQYTGGIFHVTSSHAISYDKLYKRLLRSARKAGLKYAYIIKGIDLIRVDVATGKEELMKGNRNSPSREQFRRVGGVSKEEMIHQVPPSGVGLGLICPKAILLEEMELDIVPRREMHADDFFHSIRHH